MPPRGHSSSSHSSHSSYYSQPVARPRVNQPTGYSHESVNPSRRIYAKHHDYVCYPVPWTDETTGQECYYDENGKWYDKLIYETNGRYENVPCKCESCGQESFVTLILGAWGCGVFRQDPLVVADAFKREFSDYDCPLIIYAIPDRGSSNYVAFEGVLNG